MNEEKQGWKQELDVAKKQKFLKELETLKFQSKSLERDKVFHVCMRRGDYKKNYQDLEEIELVLNEELQTERKKINDHLGKIKSKVSNFKDQLREVKPSPEFVEKLRQTMEDIESTITTFKQQQRKMFETLLTEESNLEHEIEIVQARIQNLATSIADVTSTKPMSARQARSSSTLPPEVKAFEKYLSQFGAQGGWDDYDHSSFLKIRNRFKGKLSFMRIAVNSIPGRTYEDVKEHEKWYQKFLELQNAKKNAILEWKLKKELDQPKVIVSQEEEREKERKRKEKEKREEQERLQKKKELEEWKAKKTEQAKLEMEEIERNEKRKKKLQEQQEHELSEIRSAARERLRLKKEEEDRRRWRIEAEEEEWRTKRAEQAQAEIVKFQTRDQQVMAMKHKERKRKEEEKKKKKDRIDSARAKIKIEPDRNRLYRPTDAWIQRKKQLNDRSGQGQAISMPHRAIPSWRQGL